MKTSNFALSARSFAFRFYKESMRNQSDAAENTMRVA
jgi:hypothetical protein